MLRVLGGHLIALGLLCYGAGHSTAQAQKRYRLNQFHLPLPYGLQVEVTDFSLSSVPTFYYFDDTNGLIGKGPAGWGKYFVWKALRLKRRPVLSMPSTRAYTEYARRVEQRRKGAGFELRLTGAPRLMSVSSMEKKLIDRQLQEVGAFLQQDSRTFRQVLTVFDATLRVQLYDQKGQPGPEDLHVLLSPQTEWVPRRLFVRMSVVRGKLNIVTREQLRRYFEQTFIERAFGGELGSIDDQYQHQFSLLADAYRQLSPRTQAILARSRTRVSFDVDSGTLVFGGADADFSLSKVRDKKFRWVIQLEYVPDENDFLTVPRLIKALREAAARMEEEELRQKRAVRP